MSSTFLPEPVTPILRWAGGKGRLLEVLDSHTPPNFFNGNGRYFEPFFGAGALCLHLITARGLSPERVIINDLNPDLINLYEVLQSNGPELGDFWREFNSLVVEFNALPECGAQCHGPRDPNKEACERNLHYIWVRDQQGPVTDYGQAARFLFLNRTCFNGLYRVNASGGFNVPYGHLTKPKFPTSEELSRFADVLRRIEIRNLDFEEAVEDAVSGDFVYFDPPYIAVSETAQHTAYNAGGFNLRQQVRLRNVIRNLIGRGVHILASNSDTELTQRIYAKCGLIASFPEVRRSISANAGSRNIVTEYLGSSFTSRNQ